MRVTIKVVSPNHQILTHYDQLLTTSLVDLGEELGIAAYLWLPDATYKREEILTPVEDAMLAIINERPHYLSHYPTLVDGMTQFLLDFHLVIARNKECMVNIGN